MRLSRSILGVAFAAGALAALPAAAVAQAPAANSDLAHGPQKLVDKAASVLSEMQADPKIRPVLARAIGLYILPEYGRGGFIIGGKGGAGLVVAKTGHGWSSPAFFNTGGLSIGLQAGFTGGSLVYLLMDRKALAQFRDNNKFALDAGAGLSVINYSDQAGVSSNKGDAVLWSNVKGAFAGATVGASGIHVDKDRTRDYYGRVVPVNTILAGQVRAPGATVLTRGLPR